MTDRRAALKARHRAAILAAATELLREGGGRPFSVDALAERADVSRRTVFNHFASLDDVVTTACSDVLGGVVDAFAAHTAALPVVDDSPAAMLDEIAGALRATDLVGPMAFLTRSLSAYDPESPAMASLLVRVFTELSRRLSAALTRRHPDADQLDVQLLTSTLASGFVVIHRAWWAATDAADDARSRRVWADLLEHLITVTREGHARPRGVRVGAPAAGDEPSPAGRPAAGDEPSPAGAPAAAAETED